MKKITTIGAAVLLSLSLAACGTEVVEQEEVERQAKESLEAEIGQKLKAIDCPGDLDAEKGKSIKCTLVAEDDSKVDLTVTVASIDDDKARLDFQAGNEVKR
jgi:hypothetical protein